MTHTYTITGMTGKGCQSSVEESLKKVDGVLQAKVDLKREEVQITMESHIPLEYFQKILAPNYGITIKDSGNVFAKATVLPPGLQKSEWQQLFPMFLILGYISVVSVLMNINSLVVSNIILQFLGLYYVVFSFFKLLDLNGFSISFAMYDAIAKYVPIYGKIYPFLKVAIGVLLLLKYQLILALVTAIFTLGATTIGVIRVLMEKKQLRCVSLGTTLNIPLTKAILIEKMVILFMACWMLINL